MYRHNINHKLVSIKTLNNMKVENNLQFSPGWILYRKKNQINKCHPKMLPLRKKKQKNPM